MENDNQDNINAQRWLMSNGILTDLHKDNLFMYGTIVHPGVAFVELDVDVDNKTLSYTVFINRALAKALAKYKKYTASNSIWNLFWLRRLIKKQGDLELHGMLRNFVNSYCGPTWNVSLEIKQESEYDASPHEEAPLLVGRQC